MTIPPLQDGRQDMGASADADRATRASTEPASGLGPDGRVSTSAADIEVVENEAACDRCGETDFSPNLEAFEVTDELVCDLCAEEALSEHGQFGVGA